MFFSRPQEKRTTCNCRESEGGLLRTIVWWKCVNCPHWWYRCSAFVWRTILRKHSACSLGTCLGPWLCLNIVPDTHSEPQICQCEQISPPPFSIHRYAEFSAMGKLAWAFVSNGRAVCSISTKKAFSSLKPPGKSYVPQVSMCLVRMAYFRFYNFPKIVFV